MALLFDSCCGEIYAACLQAKKAQEARMAAGKVYYDATKQLAEGKITDAIAGKYTSLLISGICS